MVRLGLVLCCCELKVCLNQGVTILLYELVYEKNQFLGWPWFKLMFLNTEA